MARSIKFFKLRTNDSLSHTNARFFSQKDNRNNAISKIMAVAAITQRMTFALFITCGQHDIIRPAIGCVGLDNCWRWGTIHE